MNQAVKQTINRISILIVSTMLSSITVAALPEDDFFKVSDSQSGQQPPQNPNNAALRLIRAEQSKLWAEVKSTPLYEEGEVIKLAYQTAKEREAKAIFKGDDVLMGIFKFDTKLERLRWDRTRDIISRANPSVYENPFMLEILARQAASIEIILRQEHTPTLNTKHSAELDRLLLFTVPSKDFDAASGTLGDHHIVYLSSGLTSYLYMAAKSVVLSWQPIEAKNSAVAFKTTPEAINQVLAEDPWAEQLLYKALYSWIMDGYPQFETNNPPPLQYQPPLSLLITHAERFVIAHEYGHIFAQLLGAESRQKWEVEYDADVFAYIMVLKSAIELDRLPPNISVQGAFFVLTALDVMRKAIKTVLCGFVPEDLGSKSHPPAVHRLASLKRIFNENNPESSMEGAMVPSKTLNLLWDRIEPKFQDLHKQSAMRNFSDIHPHWRKHSCE